MKITPKQYAEILYQSVEGKKDSQIKNALKIFVRVVIDNNDLKKVNKIVERFSKIWNEKKGIVEVEVLSANELNKSIVSLLKDYITKLSGAGEAIVKQTVDKKLLGGVVIKYEDKVLDGSLKTRLEMLRGEMIK